MGKKSEIRLWHLDIWKPNTGTFSSMEKAILGRFDKAFVGRFPSLICPERCHPQSHHLEPYCLLAFIATDVFQAEFREPFDSGTSVDHIKVPSKGNETSLHKHLKRQATHWLMNEANTWNLDYEVPFAGGIADIATGDEKWYLECGATRASKVWQLYPHSKSQLSSKLVVFNLNGISIFQAGPQIKQLWKLMAERMSKCAEALKGLTGN